MAVNFTQEKKKQKYLILILALAIIVILFIVWRSFLPKESPTAKGTLPAFSFKKAEINWGALEDPVLNELQIFEKVAPFEEEIGRENPFVPY